MGFLRQSETPGLLEGLCQVTGLISVCLSGQALWQQQHVFWGLDLRLKTLSEVGLFLGPTKGGDNRVI